MNANELADWLEQIEHELQGKSPFKLSRASYTLRQQANRISELEKCAECYRDKYYFDSPANTLTDEEILDTFNYKFDYLRADENLIEFARAILKKASEK